MTVVATAAFPGSYDVELNTKNHVAMIDEAVDAGADLVVFPEVILQGYPPDLDRISSTIRDRIGAGNRSA